MERLAVRPFFLLSVFLAASGATTQDVVVTSRDTAGSVTFPAGTSEISQPPASEPASSAKVMAVAIIMLSITLVGVLIYYNCNIGKHISRLLGRGDYSQLPSAPEKSEMEHDPEDIVSRNETPSETPSRSSLQPPAEGRLSLSPLAVGHGNSAEKYYRPSSKSPHQPLGRSVSLSARTRNRPSLYSVSDGRESLLQPSQQRSVGRSTSLGPDRSPSPVRSRSPVMLPSPVQRLVRKDSAGYEDVPNAAVLAMRTSHDYSWNEPGPVTAHTRSRTRSAYGPQDFSALELPTITTHYSRRTMSVQGSDSDSVFK